MPPSDASEPGLYLSAADCYSHERAAGRIDEPFGPPMSCEYKES